MVVHYRSYNRPHYFFMAILWGSRRYCLHYYGNRGAKGRFKGHRTKDTIKDNVKEIKDTSEANGKDIQKTF